MFLLDTNIVSELRRNRPDPHVSTWIEKADPAELFLSVLTLGEIAKGIVSLSRRDASRAASLQAWLEGLRLRFDDRLLSVDAAVAQEWGRLSGVRTLPVVDGPLAATALVHDLTVVTRNVRDLADTGIRLIDPWRT